MSRHTRRKDVDEGGPVIAPGGPNAPAESTSPSDPPAAPPGRSAGGQGAEVQVPLGHPEKETGIPGREAPAPEITPRGPPDGEP